MKTNEGLICESCGESSYYLDEICYWDINGFAISDEISIESNSNNPNTLAYILCNTCADLAFSE